MTCNFIYKTPASVGVFVCEKDDSLFSKFDNVKANKLWYDKRGGVYTGTGIFYIQGKQIMFVLIEDDALHDLIVCKMIECGNKKYSSLAELQVAVDV